MTYFIVFLAVLSRFAPHAPNFSPVYGALLFGGARLKDRDSVWFPVALVAVRDLILTLMCYRMQLDWFKLIVCIEIVSVGLIDRWVRKLVFYVAEVAAWLGW